MMAQHRQSGAHSIALVAILAFVSFLAVSCDAPKGPTDTKGGKPQIMVVGGDSVNWGKVAPGVLKHTVKIINNGGDTLKINEVRPSCGCTTAPLDKKALGPGDTGTVEVSMDVTNRSGTQHKHLTITSNDSTRPAIQVNLMADVVRDVTAVPEVFPMITNIAAGEQDTTSIQISNTGSAPVTIEPPTLPNAPEMLIRFDMGAPRQLNPGESLKVVATVKPIKEGASSTEVVFPTSSKNQPQLKVTLTVSATGKG